MTEAERKRLVWRCVQHVRPDIDKPSQQTAARAADAAVVDLEEQPSSEKLVSTLKYFGGTQARKLAMSEESQTDPSQSLLRTETHGLPSHYVALAIAACETLPWPPDVPPVRMTPEEFADKVRDMSKFWKKNAPTFALVAVDKLPVELSSRQKLDLRNETTALIAKFGRHFPKAWKLKKGVHPAVIKLARVLETTGPAGVQQASELLSTAASDDGLVPPHVARFFLKGGQGNPAPEPIQMLARSAWQDGSDRFPAEVISHALDTAGELALNGPMKSDSSLKLSDGGIASIDGELLKRVPVDLDRIGAEFVLPAVLSIAHKVQDQNRRKIHEPHIFVDASFAESARRILGRDHTPTEYKSIVRALRFGSVVQVAGCGYRYNGFYTIAEGDGTSRVKYIAYDVLNAFFQRPARGKPASHLSKRERAATDLVPVVQPFYMESYDDHFGPKSKAQQQVARFRVIRLATQNAKSLITEGHAMVSETQLREVMRSVGLDPDQAEHFLDHLQDFGDLLHGGKVTVAGESGWQVAPGDARLFAWAENKVRVRSLPPSVRSKAKRSA